MKDRGWGCCQGGDSTQGFPALFIFHIGGGGVTFSCNEGWSHGVFGVPGQCLATVSQDHGAAPVCSDFTRTVKVKPC